SEGTWWWTSGDFQACYASRVYCFEKGSGSALPPFSQPGARVFVTSEMGTGDLSTWPHANGQTGVAAGDAICRGLAAAAGLGMPESFVAWLSTVGHPAADRLTFAGPWA